LRRGLFAPLCTQGPTLWGRASGWRFQLSPLLSLHYFCHRTTFVIALLLSSHYFCHPVYNHDGSVNCFLATRPRRRGKKVFAVAFSLVRGFCFCSCCCSCCCICLSPSRSSLLRIIGGYPTPVPLPIYSVLATMISGANSPPGRPAFRAGSAERRGAHSSSRSC
jgi:hypothetical protein